MNTKKIIAGITVIGMIWAVPAVSFAGDRYDRSDRGHARMEQHHGDRGAHRNGRDRIHDRHGRDMDRGHYYRGSHRQHYNGYYDRGSAHRHHDRNEVRVSHPLVRVVVTPLGIFPVFY
ncbi:MAG: hypothetical protein AB7S75_08055 [Desulfococcaceae bacterium]